MVKDILFSILIFFATASHSMETTMFDKNETLLSAAYKTKQVQKIKDLINAKEDVKNNINNYLLQQIAFDRCGRDTQNNKTYLTIAQLLLESGADPDFRTTNYSVTPLMICTYNHDKKYAHLLLWYNAKTEKTALWFDQKIKNVFAMNGCTHWLKKLINEKQQIMFKCWTFKHYNLHSTILPQELVQLITHNVWEICKNPTTKKVH